jgi:hypothetical protein
MYGFLLSFGQYRVARLRIEISLTIVGAPIGIPLAILGFLLLLRAFF